MTDADQFEAFVRRYQDMVYATAVRLLGNPTEAEDVAQTVFLQSLSAIRADRHEPGRAGWLKTVTRNTCLNHLSRYRARWRFFSELGRSDAEGRAGYEATLRIEQFAGAGAGTGDRARATWSRRSSSSRIISACRSCSSISRTSSYQEIATPRRVARQGEDRHPPRPRGPRALLLVPTDASR